MTGESAAIPDRLEEIEHTHRVRVIYACASGSRAWGFASRDSDYDVRFLYVRPLEWYLRFDVEKQRDVIEGPQSADLDFVGWDMRKACALLIRSNGALMEWLHSPIVYRDEEEAGARLRAMVMEGLDVRGLCHHYSRMARGTAREWLNRERACIKKLLYVLRALLAVRYLIEYRAVPPVSFETLAAAVAPPELRDSIVEIVSVKRHAAEADEIVIPPKVESDIRRMLETQDGDFRRVPRPDAVARDRLRSRLNTLFRELVLGVGGHT